jgi:hypothetical protein
MRSPVSALRSLSLDALSWVIGNTLLQLECCSPHTNATGAYRFHTDYPEQVTLPIRISETPYCNLKDNKMAGISPAMDRQATAFGAGSCWRPRSNCIECIGRYGVCETYCWINIAGYNKYQVSTHGIRWTSLGPQFAPNFYQKQPDQSRTRVSMEELKANVIGDIFHRPKLLQSV